MNHASHDPSPIGEQSSVPHHDDALPVTPGSDRHLHHIDSITLRHAAVPLPYAFEALQPIISGQTLAIHYGKHYLGYLDQLNRLVEGTDLAGLPLERVVAGTARDRTRVAIFNNASQAWNHAFYWRSLRPQHSPGMPAALHALVDRSFGNVEKLKHELATAAVAQFGSGWTWLVAVGQKLRVVNTNNADSPLLRTNMRPLLTIDVWEHAYYLDRHNRRAEYVSGVVERLINWDFAAENLPAT